LADAHCEDERAIYDELSVTLTYHGYGRVHVRAGARVLGVRVGRLVDQRHAISLTRTVSLAVR
jgi:hypothetical protein